MLRLSLVSFIVAPKINTVTSSGTGIPPHSVRVPGRCAPKPRTLGFSRVLRIPLTIININTPIWVYLYFARGQGASLFEHITKTFGFSCTFLSPVKPHGFTLPSFESLFISDLKKEYIQLAIFFF